MTMRVKILIGSVLVTLILTLNYTGYGPQTTQKSKMEGFGNTVSPQKGWRMCKIYCLVLKFVQLVHVLMNVIVQNCNYVYTCIGI